MVCLGNGDAQRAELLRCWIAAAGAGHVGGVGLGERLIMRCARIKDHASFRPVTDLLRERAAQVPTPPGDEAAKAELEKAMMLLRSRKRPNHQIGVAYSWAATARPVRRHILALAGLSADRWESPIHSFTEAERLAMRHAVLRAISTYERVLNAV
nr:MAG TPA: hypothetical protein [Caudoviricetes sp.]